MRKHRFLLRVAGFAALLGLSVCNPLPGQTESRPRRPTARPNDAPPPPETSDKQKPDKPAADKTNKSPKSLPKRPARRPGLPRNFWGNRTAPTFHNEDRGEPADREGATS
ncbi:MAG TPA: hypothetical protein VFG04_02105, partial [Planctomycetaceae bacterium]|nr:hypothetical protein [Planctomycetaceae bacterium]